MAALTGREATLVADGLRGVPWWTGEIMVVPELIILILWESLPRPATSFESDATFTVLRQSRFLYSPSLKLLSTISNDNH